MLFVPDVNTLIAACVDNHQQHEATIQWLGTVDRTHHLALLTETVSGLVRITGGRLFEVSPTESIAWLQRFMATNNVSFTRPSHRQFDHFLRIMQLPSFTHHDTTDAMLAAAAIDLDATLLTWDRGFSRFPSLTWQTPADAQSTLNPS